MERAGGTFREVTVPFEVQPEGREGEGASAGEHTAECFVI